MIDMQNADSIKCSLKTLHPIIKDVKTYKFVHVTAVDVFLPLWAWVGCGFIHNHIKEKVETLLMIHGARGAKYFVEVY